MRTQKTARRPSSHRGSPQEVVNTGYAIDDSDLRMIRVLPRIVRTRLNGGPAKNHSISLPSWRASGGAEGIRTPDLRRAKAALSQLSYGPRARPAFNLTARVGGPAWNLTRDLSLIRTAL